VLITFLSKELGKVERVWVTKEIDGNWGNLFRVNQGCESPFISNNLSYKVLVGFDKGCVGFVSSNVC
jgi:hypothetical protein